MIFMMVIVFAVSGGVLFFDKLSDVLLPNLFSQVKVAMPKEMATHFDLENTKYQLTHDEEKANIVILKNNDQYHVSFDQTVSEYDKHAVTIWIESYHRSYHYQFIPDELIASIDFILFPEIVFVDDIRLRRDNGFVVITMIYFFMLGFSSTVASEVVSEKTTNMLEMMLTSISYKEHFAAKIVIGWVTVFFQMVIWGSMFLFWVICRTIYDQGKGFYHFLYKIGLNPKEYSTFIEHLQTYIVDYNYLLLLTMSLLFLMIGILIVQLVLLCVSIRIENIEESASVQAPFYLIMLLMYYGTLGINTYQHMQLGIGKYLSYIPGLSMLLMPLRIFYYDLQWYEVLFSLTLSILILGVGYHKGFLFYHNHLTFKKNA
jgi:ABC-2 type transport system permease protein